MVDIVNYIIPVIQSKAEYFRKVRDGVYQTRCPFCGDSQSNRRTGHLYLLINDSGGCICYCHKCNTKERLTNDVLTMLIGQHSFSLSEQRVRRINPSNPNIIIDTDIPARDSREYKYIKYRLGCDFTPDELLNFRIIADQQKFIDKYNIKNLEVVRDTIAFVTADGNTICYRNMIENDTFRWIKRKVYEKYESCPYTIKSSFDILSPDNQYVILAEGVFDILGVYKHVFTNGNLYAASLGKDYSRVIRWMIGKGIFGKNVHIQIYSDSDVQTAKLRQSLRQYRWMYGSISVLFNDAEKDFGVPSNQIILRDPVII